MRGHEHPGLMPVSAAGINRLVQLCYAASLTTEEGRLCRFTVVSRQAENFPILAKMETSVESPEILRRLAPTCWGDEHALWVRQEGNKLVCRGLVETDPWLRVPGSMGPVRTGFGSTFELRVRAPGEIQAGLLGLAFTLKKGELRQTASCWGVPALAALVRRVGERVCVLDQPNDSHSSDSQSSRMTRALVQYLLSRAFRFTLNARHGGTFLFTPDATWPAFTKHVNLKHPVDSRRSLVDDLVAYRRYTRELNEQAPTLTEQSVRGEDAAWERLISAVQLLARTSYVDGCVGLDDNLRLRGFGGEISVSDQEAQASGRRFRSDHTGKWLVYNDVMAVVGGMRHRSAARICMAVAGTIAIVVSQDGEMSVMYSDDRAVFIVRHLRPGIGLDDR
jgi:hypothetical protein